MYRKSSQGRRFPTHIASIDSMHPTSRISFHMPSLMGLKAWNNHRRKIIWRYVSRASIMDAIHNDTALVCSIYV